MKIIKLKAFTLAELLVIMAVLAVLMAAFAPMFTSRYTNIATGTVWQKVSNATNNNQHIYSDTPNKLLLQPSFIGITPDTAESAKNGYRPYSKVIINSTRADQKQIDFRNNNDSVGTLYARNNNILFGFPNDKNPTGERNTSFGIGALNSLTSGNRNTAVGFNALSTLTTGHNNTAIGYNASIGGGAASARNNVTIGNIRYNGVGNNNVIVRNGNTNIPNNYTVSNTVAIGDGTNFHASRNATGNVVVGNGASVSAASGWQTGYNTAIGAETLTPAGYNNTSIGYNSGRGLTLSRRGYNITTIDNNILTDSPMGSNLNNVLNSNASNSHVYIGDGTDFGPAALEVHSGQTINSTVIINGNLVVRGQTYVGNPVGNFLPLTALSLGPVPNSGTFRRAQLLDYTYSNRRMRNNNGFIHDIYNGREGCVCTADSAAGLKSYDWTVESPAHSNVLAPEIYATNNHYGTFLYSGSPDNIVSLDAAKGRPANDSCCPNLYVSDARLKNIGEKFTPSYDELLKLAIYNYSYKTEGKKPTHVGVIAQDLKKVFPNAVSKDENGYYKIRWDEMFYAMVNAVKDLNTKVKNLIVRVENDKAKIKALKADNKKLEQKLDELSKEIAKLEK